jgi:predicted AlkP superfamily phosphohydrolase/phosphomutase
VEEITQFFGRDTIGHCDHLRLKTVDDYCNFRDDLLERVRRKTGLNLFLLQKGGWDCFFSVYHEAHCAGHQCWHFHDPIHPRQDPDMVAEVGDILQQVYRVIDEGIGRILDHIGPQTNMLLFCSHGMTAGYNGSHMLDDVLLHLEGVEAAELTRGMARSMGRTWRMLPQGVRAFAEPLRSFWPALRRNLLEPSRHERKCFEVNNNDTCSGVRFNIIGREPHGLLEPGDDAEAFCERLTDNLLSLKLLGTDTPAIKRVIRTDEVFTGPRRADLPDLLIDWNREAPIYGVWSIKLGFVENKNLPTRSGSHSPVGMFMALGPDYPSLKLNATTSVFSFAPTIARLFGVDQHDADASIAEPLLGAMRQGADAA